MACLGELLQLKKVWRFSASQRRYFLAAANQLVGSDSSPKLELAYLNRYFEEIIFHRSNLLCVEQLPPRSY